MSHGFPKRLRRQRREKRPQLQPKPVVKSIAADKISTSGIISELSRPVSSRAFDEALRESQTATNI